MGDYRDWFGAASDVANTTGNAARYGSGSHNTNPAPGLVDNPNQANMDINQRNQSAFDYASHWPIASNWTQDAVNGLRYMGSNVNPVLALNPFADQGLWQQNVNGIVASPDQLYDAANKGHASAGGASFLTGFLNGRGGGGPGNGGVGARYQDPHNPSGAGWGTWAQGPSSYTRNADGSSVSTQESYKLPKGASGWGG